MTRRDQASSLVLVVVAMAVIITIVFGASRLTLVQYNQSNRDEDNIFARYAAKAGIEDGLLRFRHNRDAETTDKKVQRYNLTAGSSLGEVDENSQANISPTDQYYDMLLNFRAGQIGSFDVNVASNPTVVKDDSLELTGFPIIWPSPYYLRYRFEFTDCVGNLSAQLVQIQQISQTADPSKPIAYDQIVVKKPAVGTVVDSTGSTNIFIRSNPGPSQTLKSSIRLRPYGCSIKYALATANTDTGTGQGNNIGPTFDNFTSIITSTGYYGDAKLTLIAEINRLSGQLISIYDFNIYSGTGDIKP